jgi:hypothetical protein
MNIEIPKPLFQVIVENPSSPFLGKNPPDRLDFREMGGTGPDDRLSLEHLWKGQGSSFRTLCNSIGLYLLCEGFSGADYQRGFNL